MPVLLDITLGEKGFEKFMTEICFKLLSISAAIQHFYGNKILTY
jgi:hypothetical protein